LLAKRFSQDAVHVALTNHSQFAAERPTASGAIKMHDLGEDRLRLCYSEFRKHCIERHDLQVWDSTPQLYLDLENWLLTLIKS
jgi:hypothetical protein